MVVAAPCVSFTIYTPVLSGDTSKRPLATAALRTCFPRISNTVACIVSDPVEVMFTKPLLAWVRDIGLKSVADVAETVFEDKVSLNVSATVKLSIIIPSFLARVRLS